MADGATVTVPLPKQSAEARADIVKRAKKAAEACKQRVRKARKDTLDDVKKGGTGVSEDDKRRDTAAVDAVAETFTAMISDMVAEKEAEVMQ